MKFLLIVALAAALPLHATTASAADAKPAAAHVAGQKIDNGLGELPHYRLWTDPSGKNPMGKAKVGKTSKAAKAVAPAPVRVAGLK